jgi:hypothetical protein
MLDNLSTFQETFLQEHASFSALGKKGLYIYLEGNELKIKQLNFIQQIVRKIFGMYAETHAATIREKLSIAKEISIKNYISSAHFTCDEEGALKPLTESPSSFYSRELREGFTPRFFSTRSDQLDCLKTELDSVFPLEKGEEASITRIAPNSYIVNSIAKKTLQAIDVIDYLLVLKGKDSCTFFLGEHADLKESVKGSAMNPAFEDLKEINGFKIAVKDEDGSSTLTANKQELEGYTLSLGAFKTESGKKSEGFLSYFATEEDGVEAEGITILNADIENAAIPEDLLKDTEFAKPYQKSIFIKALATIKKYLIED